MTRDELLKLIEQGKTPIFSLVEMYALVENAVLKEREACAMVCDNYDIRAKTPDGWIILKEAQRVSSELATKIRARGDV